MPDSNEKLCLRCSNVDFAQYFRNELHVLRRSDGFVGPAPGAVRLCSLDELYATSATCASCRLIIAAFCTRWGSKHLPDPLDFLHWAQAQDGISGIYLYSYLYAEDSSRDVLKSTSDNASHSRNRRSLHLAIALRESTQENIPYLDHAAAIQLLQADMYHTDLAAGFHGRILDPARANVRLAGQWLEECEKHHKSCCEIGSGYDDVAYVQKALQNLRVIDVRTLSLVSLPQHSEYIALSYCWGQSKRPFLTKRSNIVELQATGSLRRIFSLLPRAIQDAINCVREMGRNYLWVDALCIIQDDTDDTETQVHQMDQVYYHASLTFVSAPGKAHKSNEYDGLPCYRSGSRTFRQNTARIQGIELCTTLPSAGTETMGSPWTTRAWTFQEQQLSRRRLYFTDTQLYFQCSWGVFCEDVSGESKARSSFVYPGVSLYNASGLSNEISSDYSQITEGLSRKRFAKSGDAFHSYAGVVGLYTSRHMSDQGDALNALEGVLSVLMTTMNTNFIHGLPERFLDEALLWLSREPLHRRTALSKGRSGVVFPSWSWAGWMTRSDYYAQFVGYVRREIDWYLLDEDGATFRLLPQDDWAQGLPFDPSGHQDVYPSCSPPEQFIKTLQTRPDMTKRDLSSCSLVCWTSIASLQLLGDLQDLGEDALQWDTYEAFLISDFQPQTVGTIFLERSWHNRIEKQKTFEFMLLSRSNEADDMPVLNESVFPDSEWSLLNVMLIQREGNIAHRLGVGVVHEIAWISMAPKPTLVYLA